MNVSPSEAEEALAAIQTAIQKTRHSITHSGAYVTLIATGIVWLVGFTCTQFLQGEILVYIWVGLSILGSALGVFLGTRIGKRIRSPSTAPIARRIGAFWLLLALYAIAVIGIAHPTDGQQVTMLVILFIMLGQLAMSLLFSLSAVWWVLPVTALALIGYLLLPDIFYLWMAVLGGGGMIALGLYIRSRW
ncbi:MAG: hypothetical protein HPY76_00105 [Anaerolineae bacterium]|jgi:hypothetical protein|nr:hypothetical protein [Anaerolineae bacterium]